MSINPKLRQEVYGDGDNITGNAMEPGGWSLADDAHKPGRLWSGKSFWLNPARLRGSGDREHVRQVSPSGYYPHL